MNVEGTKNLIDVAGAGGGSEGGSGEMSKKETRTNNTRRACRAFVFTSSPSVISDGKSDLVNADERWPYVPLEKQEEYYAQTKVGSIILHSLIEPKGREGIQPVPLKEQLGFFEISTFPTREIWVLCFYRLWRCATYCQEILFCAESQRCKELINIMVELDGDSLE